MASRDVYTLEVYGRRPQVIARRLVWTKSALEFKAEEFFELHDLNFRFCSNILFTRKRLAIPVVFQR